MPTAIAGRGGESFLISSKAGKKKENIGLEEKEFMPSRGRKEERGVVLPGRSSGKGGEQLLHQTKKKGEILSFDLRGRREKKDLVTLGRPTACGKGGNRKGKEGRHKYGTVELPFL